jgi:hypothetical protein
MKTTEMQWFQQQPREFFAQLTSGGVNGIPASLPMLTTFSGLCFAQNNP